jgi:hypothetical protein
MNICQHRLGGYRYHHPAHVPPPVFCGKPATHVATYPGKPPFYLCAKHSKTRLYVSPTNTAAQTATEKDSTT